MLYLPGEPETWRIHWHALYREWIRPGLTLLIAVVLLNLFLPRYQVEGQSMQPTLHDWERVFGGVVYVNDQPLDETYVEERPRYAGEWALGADEYFVLGDNRNHSTDSHSYGALPASRIQGVVRLRFWPPSALQWFTPPRYGE